MRDFQYILTLSSTFTFDALAQSNWAEYDTPNREILTCVGTT